VKRLLAAITAALLVASPVAATSAWSDPGVQWATRQPFTLYVIDQTTGAWPGRVAQAANEWSASSVADVVVGGKGKFKVTVANGTAPYACAWMTFTTSNDHLKTASIFLNDTCLAQQAESFRQTAICQELGHALGLPDHRTDVPVATSCMAPQRYGPSPDADDFAKLAELYP